PEGTIARINDLSPTRRDLPRMDVELTYDRLYQLIGVSKPEGDIAYRYDEIQNLIEREVAIPFAGLKSGELSYGGNGAGPNAVTEAFGERYRYDGAGRLRSYNGFDLEFDIENRLVEARHGDGTRIRWGYDIEGERRVSVVSRPGEPERINEYPFAEHEVREGHPLWRFGVGPATVEVSQSP